ncbi:tRNA1(Val) (adenine(37)-N6)-methyltransferase [Listeria fleischmannii]|jgi:tRNA1(Val) A37 N6-methylase TrmN6|uniref:Methyltransferase small domain-containing protein n=2 Tax=Listeria fleischmannii TaxID=1069827 RepID=W7DSW1_9LIST|nr:tRNA1(Val) (adenine(37)-N6)-methyltransferase [Listeria fleischmannii]EIA19293.1 methyltransferase small domain-containing protein [Listeria fleischmannii subsp. coloradonensis]EUJ48890.1 methyltransferase small domain-containing protein [Listeria fleischmannii FSL S10-1203]MBC1399010.1 tRNA1(Val) (adenine(37)-N6)-methyltransferase [Listeria fleischmannii]MBC1427263.1 tRNA1(Val) (adenine(37)-N6)-methyltransferase [Listeria fleischmannii]
MLKGDERLDYLLAEEKRIIQSPSVFSFSLDAVLLAHFTYIPRKKGDIIDLCSGNGIIPLLLSKHTEVPITGVEIQPRLADMARRSVTYNHLADQITILEEDLRGITKILGKEKHQIVTCNPPYFNTPPSSKVNENEHYKIARHEVMCTLRDTIRVSAELLRQGGKASFVHRPDRLVEIIDLMREYRLEPKRVQFVHPRLDKDANMVLVEGMKDAKSGVRYLPPIFVHEQNGDYTPLLKEILYGESK